MGLQRIGNGWVAKMDNKWTDPDLYFQHRLNQDAKRIVTWRALVKYYFQHLIPVNSRVLELGAGYCDFINNVEASSKFAVDVWEGITRYAGKDVTTIVGSAENLQQLVSGQFDIIFASNFLEHFSVEAITLLLDDIKIALSPGGKLMLVQTNYRLDPGRYFDDYTHISIWTDSSLHDFLEAMGFKVEIFLPKFLPLTVKSKFPVHRWLIWMYLKIPIKFKAGQMFVCATLNPD